jgi:hypothetical protein
VPWIFMQTVVSPERAHVPRVVQQRLRRTATPHPRPGRSLLAALVRARQAARRSSLGRTAPASAGSRSLRTGKAHQPGLPGTPRGSRARTDHMSRSSPATCRSAAGPRCPVRGPVLIAHHFTSASPPRSEPVRPAPVTGVALTRRVPAAGSASSGGWACCTGACSQPPINTERPLPLTDTGAARQ